MRGIQVTKKQIKKLDDWWSEEVKVRAGYKCEFCGGESRLNSHHIYSRSNRSVRWDVSNGVCLCVSHHVFGNMSAHKSPMEFSEWLKIHRGEEWSYELTKKAHLTSKLSYEEVKLLYKINVLY